MQTKSVMSLTSLCCALAVCLLIVPSPSSAEPVSQSGYDSLESFGGPDGVIKTIRLNETKIVISSGYALSLNSNEEFRTFCENSLKMTTKDSSSISASSVRPNKIGNRFFYFVNLISKHEQNIVLKHSKNL